VHRRASHAASSRRPRSGKEKLYIAAIGDVLKQYTIANAVVSASPTLQASDVFGFPGATPAISSNGAAGGIVWVLDTTNNGTPNGSGSSAPAVLIAYDATTLTKLFSSPTNGAGGCRQRRKIQRAHRGQRQGLRGHTK
jgi:hypothetical protein